MLMMKIIISNDVQKKKKKERSRTFIESIASLSKAQKGIITSRTDQSWAEKLEPISKERGRYKMRQFEKIEIVLPYFV